MQVRHARRPRLCGLHGRNFYILRHSLFTPRDFDVSPYFKIIKARLSEKFNPATLRWELTPTIVPRALQ